VEHLPITKVLSESDVGVLAIAQPCAIQFHVTFQVPHDVLVTETLHSLCGERVGIPLLIEHVDVASLSEHHVVQHQYGAAHQKV
jgi:hypothetical protein